MISVMCNHDRQRSCTPHSLLPRVVQSTITFPDPADGPVRGDWQRAGSVSRGSGEAIDTTVAQMLASVTLLRSRC